MLQILVDIFFFLHQTGGIRTWPVVHHLFLFYDNVKCLQTRILYAIFFLFCISVAGLPTDYDDDFWGARAVTSASGQGAIVQYGKYFYELTCEISGCTWRILPKQLDPGVVDAVMMTLPSDYNACQKMPFYLHKSAPKFE